MNSSITPQYTDKRKRPQPGPELKFEELSSKTSEALLEAIKTEMLDIIGDKVDVRRLNELSRFSHTAQELLMIRTPLAEVRRKSKPHMMGGGAGSAYGGMYGMNGMGPYQPLYDCDMDPLTTEAAQHETFGANLSREIVSLMSAAKRNGPPLEELVNALGEAKKQGLTTLAAKLEVQIEARMNSEPEAEPQTATEAEPAPDVEVCDENCDDSCALRSKPEQVATPVASAPINAEPVEAM